MKITGILKSIIAMAALAFASATTVQAANAKLGFSDGDLYLGIRVVGSGQGSATDYVAILGNVQTLDFTKSINFSLNLGADLTATYGANWYNRTDLVYSIIGNLSYDENTGLSNTLYSTNPSITPFNSNWDQSEAGNAITTMALQSVNGKTSTANSDFALTQSTSSPYSYASYQPGGANYGGSSFNLGFSNEGTVSTTLFFNESIEGSTDPSTVLGTFSISNDGALSYQAVPEPSTYAMLGVGAIGVIGMIRRRRLANA